MPGTRFPAVMVRARAVLCCAGLLALLAACGSNPPPQAEPVGHAQGIPAGYTEFRDPGRGYAIAVPSSWIQVSVQSPGAAAALAQMVKMKPQLTRLLGGSLASLAEQDVSLLAAGPAGTGLDVVVEPGAGTVTAAQLGTLYSEAQSAYSDAGIKVLSHQVSSLGGYPALRISFTYVLRKKAARETQFLAGAHGNGFVLTIVDATPALTSQIAGTVRFL